MDGLLIDSEPLWQEAEITVFNKLGVRLTLEMTHQTMGLRTDEVVEYWHKIYHSEMPSLKDVSEMVDATVINLIMGKSTAKAGERKAIAVCEPAGLPLAIASSSSTLFIKSVLEKLSIADKLTLIHLAHDEDYGKPHPAVHINTAKDLDVHPNHCLAFEDPVNGVLAAKAAKMKCIAIPEAQSWDDKRFGIADMLLLSLNDFNREMLNDW